MTKIELLFYSPSQNFQDTNQYVLNEIEALEREQAQIDCRAAVLERQLRRCMEKS